MNNGRTTTYVGLYGDAWDLMELDAQELLLLTDLQKKARVCEHAKGKPAQRWSDYCNYRVEKILGFYKARGLTRNQIVRTALHQIGQDMSGRLGIALGVVTEPTYRGRLNKIIETKFKNRRAFCKATGLSEDMLSHVLAGRKDLSVKALSKALDRIGYSIEFVPNKKPKAKSA